MSLEKIDKLRVALLGLLDGGVEKAVKTAEDAVNNSGMMEDIMRARFATEGGSSGTSWEPDKPDKRNNGPLQRSGALMRGAMYAVRRAFRMFSGVDMSQWSINNVPISYARWVNQRRPFMGLPGSAEMARPKALAKQVFLREILKNIV